MPQLILASQSPRRQELLQQLGVSFTTVFCEIDEQWDGQESARSYVQRLALEKARAGREQVTGEPKTPVLGADTAVVIDGTILGKPRDDAHAMSMLALLSGRRHTVYTALALVAEKDHLAVNTSTVTFRPLTDAERYAYVQTGEPFGKAGGYAIQGLAAAFIQRLEGSYTGVMGLPLFETAGLLEETGIGFFLKPV